MATTHTLERVEPGIALLTLRRPQKLNALSWEMIAALHDRLREVAADAGIRVLVVTGEGRGFCSGMDLGSPDAVGSADDVVAVYRRQERVAGLATALRELPQPVIAAVNGPCAGGGLGIALACDIRIAAPQARFNVAFARIGLSGGDVGVSYLLPRLVGLGMASELMLTGRMVDSEEAVRIGIANRVVPADALLETSLSLARDITANAPFAVRMTKQVLRQNIDATSLESAIELENRTQVLATRTEDMREALTAFVEKRPPDFTGR